MGYKNISGVFLSVERDRSLKDTRNGKRRYHNCYRASIDEYCNGKRISRTRKRFKTPSEAWVWLGQIPPEAAPTLDEVIRLRMDINQQIRLNRKKE